MNASLKALFFYLLWKTEILNINRISSFNWIFFSFIILLWSAIFKCSDNYVKIANKIKWGWWKLQQWRQPIDHNKVQLVNVIHRKIQLINVDRRRQPIKKCSWLMSTSCIRWINYFFFFWDLVVTSIKNHWIIHL